MFLKQRPVLAGFTPTLSYTLFYLSLIVLLPIAAVLLKVTELSWSQFWDIITAERVLAAYRLSFGMAFCRWCLKSPR